MRWITSPAILIPLVSSCVSGTIGILYILHRCRAMATGWIGRSGVKVEEEFHPSKLFSILVMVWCSISLVVLLVLLAIFVRYRSSVIAIAGSSVTELQWGFGQVLAVATWLPTLLDFSVILKGKRSPFHLEVLVCWGRDQADHIPCIVKGHLGAIEYRLPLGMNVHFVGDIGEQLGEELQSPRR